MTTPLFFLSRESVLWARRWCRFAGRGSRMRRWRRRIVMLRWRRRAGFVVQRRMDIVVVVLGFGGRRELHCRVLLRGVVRWWTPVAVRPFAAVRLLPIVAVRVGVDVRARISVGIFWRLRQTVVGVHG